MNFIRVTLLITLIFAGVALYLSIPTPKLQKCIMYQYNLMSMDTQTKHGLVKGILSESRMLCINVNKEDPL